MNLTITKITPPAFYRTPDGNEFDTFPKAQEHWALTKKLKKLEEDITEKLHTNNVNSMIQLFKIDPEFTKRIRNSLTELVDYQNVLARKQ